jgi:hypothetical protein
MQLINFLFLSNLIRQFFIFLLILLFIFFLGNLFIKHHKYGNPKLRLIWLNEDLTEIHWGDPSETKNEK